MSEQPQENVNPNKGDGATSDPNWHGDAGDQGNDLRFAEEQQLINSQAQNADPEAGGASGTTGGYTGAQTANSDGGYTEGQDAPTEGEYTDADGVSDNDAEVEGEYTDVDSVPSLQDGAADESDRR
ncbi:hypothetical protein BJ994_003413 [Arthrobacter pigmenti]|uniref:Uncharacterized protein n=1 Tax=Arthrobacter pigmenti TaxID=271432 RepID=A0A846RVX5_9MICC|nr:hypothetical protein [Arthrobacter pigmenti]NJC24337.1 hypothetical protein [Arthrobacter pigmenti]